MTNATPVSTLTAVTGIPAASPAEARAHFAGLLAFEADCWDVHEAMTTGEPDFVLLDVRSPAAFAAGHVAGSVSLPHREITEPNLRDYPAETLFVVYCNGPHCNGADRAALRVASLGRPVKKMIGGVAGWHDEGFTLTQDS